MLVEDKLQRRAGVLVPLFSLRHRGWGLGEIPDIVPFAAWASAAGFSILQLLPVGEICGGETSPYSAATAFALDPVYLGLDACEDFRAAGGREGLSAADRSEIESLSATPTVEWHRLRPLKARASAVAFERFLRDEWQSGSERARALNRFCQERAEWLDDYTLFAVLHDRFLRSWVDWPTPLRDREPKALAAAREEHRDQLLAKAWMQWQLHEQWHQARAQAARDGVALMGDLPFMVSLDSADVWARRNCFRIDKRVGTPPDAFSAEGQDWGLPLYDWKAMADDDFAWVRARAAHSGDLFSLYRVDHVIGLYRTFYRSVAPATPGDAAAKTAAANDAAPVDELQDSGFSPAHEKEQLALGEKVLGILADAGEVVAEDLGMVPDFLRPSLTAQGIPGYRVLRWEKDDAPHGQHPRLVFRDPATWPVLSVATSGTHDIESNAEWYDALGADERAALARVPGLEVLAKHPTFDDIVRDALLLVLYAAPSELALVPVQDALGTRERVNVPGTVNDSNWTYRMTASVAALSQDRATTLRLARLAAHTQRQGDSDQVPRAAAMGAGRARGTG